MRVDIRIERSFTRMGYGLWIINRDLQNRKTYVAKPIELEFEEKKEGFFLPEPTLFFPEDEAADYFRAINDAISLAGIQSSKEDRRDREMLAIKNHLNDAIRVRDILLQRDL